MPSTIHPKFMTQPAVSQAASSNDDEAATTRAIKSSSVLTRIMALDGFLKPRRSSSSKAEQQQQQQQQQQQKIGYKGRTRAVFIGINYYNTSAELYGCVNDAKSMRSFLKSAYQFPANDQVDVLMLTDEPINRNTWAYPTKANMVRAFEWLVQGAQPGDSLFVHYSGHGGYARNRLGQEKDGFDETIYPVDYPETGPILDDFLFEKLVRPLAAGVKLTAFFDSCHSGTILDLPYLYNERGENIVQPIEPNDDGSVTAAGCWSLPFLNPFLFGASGVQQTISAGAISKAERAHRRQHPILRDIAATVMCFTGCRDNEANPRTTYAMLLTNTRRALKRDKFNQTPCLATNRPLGIHQIFSMEA